MTAAHKTPELIQLHNVEQLVARPEAQVLVCDSMLAAEVAQKLVDAAKMRVVVTTWFGGGNGISLADWSPLLGREAVLLTGSAATERLTKTLSGIVVAIKVIDGPSDAADGWIASAPETFDLKAHAKAHIRLVWSRPEPAANDDAGSAAPAVAEPVRLALAPARRDFASFVAQRYTGPDAVLVEHFDDAVAAAASVGALLDEIPELDGGRVYLANTDGKRDKRQYVRASLVEDRDGTTWPFVTFGTYRHGGATAVWKPRDLVWQEFEAWRRGGATLTSACRREEYQLRAAELQAKAAAKRAVDEEQAEHGRRAAAEIARKAWDAAGPDIDHPYLSRKHVQGHGLRVATSDLRAELWNSEDGEWQEVLAVSAGDLLVPMHAETGELVNLQRIDAQGGKRFLLGGLSKDCSFKIEGTTGRTVIVEGFATGATWHEATGDEVVTAFSAGNLAGVAAYVHPHLVAADNDASGTGEKAARATGLPYCMPSTAGTDWNDGHVAEGLDAVRAEIEAELARIAAGAPTARALAEQVAEQVAGAREVVDAQPKDEVKVLAPTAPATREIALVNPQEIDAIENSDDALALQFVECAGNFRWSPGLGWMIDNGVTWSRDDAMHRFDLARRVCRAVAATCGPKAEAEAKRISSAKTVNATVTLAQSDRQMVVPTSEWDADPLLLNTPGGVVDLRTGKMRERGIEYVTQTAMVAPDFSAECPTWLRFLQQVFLDDATMIEFMQRSMGYWLSGSVREQVIHFLHGQGSNGKSVLSDLVKWIVGSYGVKLTATALMQSRGERHPTELAQLRGKRLALSSELGEHDYFNEALLKELTGDATLSARFMRGDFFEFQMSQKHLIVGNFKPRLRGGDPAIARRMLLVPFNATFKGAAKDMGLLDKLKAEAPAIVAWMIHGAVKWYAEGLAVPESVRAASADYMAAMDDLGLWMGECCEMTGEAKAKDLYASFSAWKKARGENAPSQTIWGERMTSHPGITRRTSNGARYTGIRLTAVEAGIQVPSDEAWGGVGDAVSAEFGSYSDIRG